MDRLEVLSSVYSNETDLRQIHFVFTGPSHMYLFIDAKKLDIQVPVMLIVIIQRLRSIKVSLCIEAKPNQPIDVVFVGHYLETTTPELKKFFDSLPFCTLAISLVSTWAKKQI
ncbi:hypothetical protein PsorP6_013637 [Peronosclerospora sorghi]|uniref:Uncharacterized protein n=1 Tax=Peronosclerospora sorghi TaxID=230839 RepID=A0ACC0VJH3_9STRA|nr:hypothetical protein PsorP6_013637 [Peronosclerospora sorghi]